MKRIGFTAFFLLTGIIIAMAQDMSLNECIRYALENNLAYANKNIEAFISNEQYRQSKRNFLPEFGAGSTANKRFGRSIDPTTNAFVNQDFFSMNFYLDSQLELFRGFTKINSVKFQKLQYLMRREDIKQKEMEIAFAVMNKYYDILYFSNLQNIVKEQVELTTLNVEKTKKMIDLGLKAEADLLEMKAQEASESHNLALAQNQHDLAVLALKNLMNYPSSEELHIETETMLASPDTLLLPGAVYETALQHFPSVKRARLDVQASQKKIDIERGNLSPKLTLGGGVYSNYADSRMERVDPNNPDNPATRVIPFKEQLSQNLSQSIYLSLQIPIFNKWNRQSRIKQARLERLMAFNRQKEAEQNLYQLINEDMQQITAFRKELGHLQAKKEALQEAYVIADKKLEQGLISIIEFYTAKNQLAQAEADWVRTLLQLKVKEKTIHFYLGETVY